MKSFIFFLLNKIYVEIDKQYDVFVLLTCFRGDLILKVLKVHNRSGVCKCTRLNGVSVRGLKPIVLDCKFVSFGLMPLGKV